MRAFSSFDLNRSRSEIPFLVMRANRSQASAMKQTLKAIGFEKVSEAHSHVRALEKVRRSDYSVILFDAAPSDMPASEFVVRVMEIDDQVTLIPISRAPRVDDVFNMLRGGAKGYLVDPYTADTVERALERAHQAPPFSEAVLHASDRNAGLVGVVLNSLYRLCILMHQARRFPRAAEDCQQQKIYFVESVELARTFCEGSDEDLRDAMIEGCIYRAKTSSTRLGRTRKRLQREREKTNMSA